MNFYLLAFTKSHLSTSRMRTIISRENFRISLRNFACGIRSSGMLGGNSSFLNRYLACKILNKSFHPHKAGRLPYTQHTFFKNAMFAVAISKNP